MYHDDLKTIAAGAGITTALLLAEHLAYWPHRHHLPLTVRYILGTAAIGAGVSHIGMARGEHRSVVGFWVCAAVGGAAVIAAHSVRERMARPGLEAFYRALYGERLGEERP